MDDSLAAPASRASGRRSTDLLAFVFDHHAFQPLERGVRLAADVVYTHPVYDLAILAPRGGPWPQGIHALQLASMRARDRPGSSATRRTTR